jgi:hypothetical protein
MTRTFAIAAAAAAVFVAFTGTSMASPCGYSAGYQAYTPNTYVQTYTAPYTGNVYNGYTAY